MNKQTCSSTLLFYSPPYAGSDFFGHLVEHCINQTIAQDYNHYFAFQQPLDIQYVHNLFSKTTIPWYIDFNHVLEQFQKPLQNEVITREVKVLRNELSGIRDQEELLADQVSTFLWYPLHSNKMRRVNYEKLKEYHQQWYQNWYRIIIDDCNSIIDTNITRWYDWPVQYATTEFIYREFRPKGFKYLVLIAPTKNPYNAMFVAFLERIIKYWETYSLRYQQWNYYRRDYDSSYAQGHMYIWVSHLNDYSFDQEFFEAAKRYFLEKERMVHGKYMIRIWEILNHQRLDDQTVQKFIRTIHYETVREVLQKVQLCNKK